ncbi:MAG: MBL fold metallo-hydrolase [Bacteroidetes bacterium]|nr:MBL fold metallo-hydrolase [Bacteroidota bacterium]
MFSFLFYLFLPQKLKSAKNELLLHHTPFGFKNIDPNFKRARGIDVFNWLISRGARRSFSKEIAIIPSTTFNKELVQNKNQNSVTWIGHSTALIRFNGKIILTDPIWSETAGPLNLMGAKRYTPPTILRDQIPEVDIILISHNHYDHLDTETIKFFGKNKNTKFFVPLKLKEFFTDLGIENVIELDWWEEKYIFDFKIVCTPAQHFSGRTMFDGDETLWASWVVTSKNKKLYFAGDSAYFNQFKEIGKNFGPFDLALIPIGAYLPRNIMGPVHVDPKESIQTFLDINAKFMLPIHWGTFRMADEQIDQPPKDLIIAAKKMEVDWNLIAPFKIGETKIW